MKIDRLLLHLLIIMSLTGCASVSMVSSHKDQNAPKKSYRDFLVVGITENSRWRQVFEEVMAGELRKKGVLATPSYTITGVEAKLSRELIEKAVQAHPVDAVITTRVVNWKSEKETDVGYVMSDRGNFGAVSFAIFDLKPVEITTSTTVALESNLFDTATQKMIWTGSANAIDPKGLITVSEKYAGSVIKAMSTEGLIP
jgi:hypothetical protein